MSFLAKLILEENEYNVLSAEYALSRPVDSTNRPNGRLRGGVIDLTMETTANSEIIGWIQYNQTKNGSLEFTSRDTIGSTQKTIEFSNAFCVYLREIFVADGSSPMLTKITISAHEMNIDNEILRNEWAGVESSSSGEGEGGSGTSSGNEQTSNTVNFD